MDKPVARPALEEVQSLIKGEHYRQAEALCERICAEPGADARVWQILGAIHGQNNDVARAEACTRQALSIDPALVTAQHNLAHLLMRQDKPEAAAQCLGHALAIRPDNAVLHYELGNALCMAGRDSEAIGAFRQAIRINPRFPDAHFQLGNVFHELKDYHSALGCMRAAYACDHSFEKAKVAEAAILERQGDYEGAWCCLAPLLEKETGEPRFGLALAFAAVGAHVGKEPEAIDCLLRAIRADQGENNNLRDLYFSLGKLQEQMQQYDAAFQSYTLGNRLAEVPNNADEFIAQMHLSRKVYAKDAVASMPRVASAGEGLIFIVGMPRSGTSLVEQILSAHPRVHACGELELLPGIARDVLLELQDDGNPGGTIASLNPQSVERYRHRYLNTVRANFGSMEQLTDKLPHNFLYLGLIDLLFPGAHVIHCRRNPLDTCVSCYGKSFTGDNLAYTNDLESLGRVYQEYVHLMDYWNETLAVPVLDVPYEAVVADTEQGIRRILEFCGLEWEQECLDFHKQKRQVYTSSYDQVRQPVYARSVNRWRRFDKSLGPLKASLGELAVRD